MFNPNGGLFPKMSYSMLFFRVARCAVCEVSVIACRRMEGF